MSQKREYDIHDIIKRHPYLLGNSFKNLKLKHEKIYRDRTRSDFVFTNECCSIVVEIKKDLVDVQTLKQALHYLNNEKKENPESFLKGILIGRRTTKQLENKIIKSEYKFEIKLLNLDIPTRIKICDKCRKANAISNKICKYCGTNKFIIDPFLFV